MRLGVFVVLASAACSVLSADVLPLWEEGRIPSSQSGQSRAELVCEIPPTRTTRACLIIAPGGAYTHLAWEREFVPARDYFLSKGLTVVGLRYRVPRPEGLPKHATALQDAQRAIRLVRANAAVWDLDPDRIGMMGFSAGGHLAMLAAFSSTSPSYSPVDEKDSLPCRLNFVIPVYPAYVLADAMEEPNPNRGNDLSVGFDPALLFDSSSPPACFLHGDADSYTAMGSVRAWLKLRQMGVSAELHVFALEGHAFFDGAAAGTPAAKWKDRVWEWLVKAGLL